MNLIVSCLCITQGRPQSLLTSIRCFLNQTLDESEMVILTDEQDFETIELVNNINNIRIRLNVIRDMNSYSLGELRNKAIQLSNAPYVCTWDDDDWFNVDRLEILIGALKRYRKPCVVQSRVLLYDETKNTSFFSYRRMWENTLIVEKKYLYDHAIWYPHINRNEDYQFLNKLIETNSVYAIEEACTYIYRFSGNNTCGKEHFDVIFGYSIELPNYHNIILSNAFNNETPVEKTSKSIYSQYFLSQLPYVPNVENRI